MTLEMIGTQSIHPDYSNLHKIFSDDQEMATNQKIGLCDYLRTEWKHTL